MVRIVRWMKEPFSGLSHLAGTLLSVAGLVALLITAQGRPWHTVSVAIYGSCLILLYLSSTLYHTLPLSEKGTYRLQHLDFCAIFLLIAGTYTPICLVTLRGAWGWSLFAAVWSIAVTGIAMSLFWRRGPHALRVVLYIVMGWLAVIAMGPLRAALPPSAIGWLVFGGVIYTAGTIVYATDRPHLWPGRFSAHDLWHLFVMAGSACHFLLIMRYVLAV